MPDGPVGEIKALRDALKPFLIATANTPNIPRCGGITTYLPLRREDTHPMFADSPVATTSGKLAYLKELFKAQETLGSSKPAVRNIVYTLIGRPPRTQSRRQTTGHDRTTQEKKNTSKTKKDANKIFGKDEGEYVDFEEIKD